MAGLLPAGLFVLRCRRRATHHPRALARPLPAQGRDAALDVSNVPPEFCPRRQRIGRRGTLGREHLVARHRGAVLPASPPSRSAHEPPWNYCPRNHLRPRRMAVTHLASGGDGNVDGRILFASRAHGQSRCRPPGGDRSPDPCVDGCRPTGAPLGRWARGGDCSFPAWERPNPAHESIAFAWRLAGR